MSLLIATVLLATFTVSDSIRIGTHTMVERGRQAQIATQNNDVDTNRSVAKDNVDKAVEDGSNTADGGAEAASAGARVTAVESPAARVQGAVSQASVRQPSMTRSGSNFSKTMGYLRSPAWDDSRIPILKAACDWSAFSCEEIIKFANGKYTNLGTSYPVVLDPFRWANEVRLFAEGRNHEGCVSDPANAKSIVDVFESRWPAIDSDGLKQTFIGSEGLKAAKGVGPPPMRLHTGFRSNEDMVKLVSGVKELQLIKQPLAWYEPGSPDAEEFETWLKQIRAHGHQFSGPQLVTLSQAIPQRFGLERAALVLFQYLEQYVIGITCDEVKLIIERFLYISDELLYACLDALKSNIVDGQNIVEMLTYLDDNIPRVVKQVGEVLRDVGGGLSPKNNPIFGVVKGNPVILVLDESTSMDAKFTLGDKNKKLRKYCHKQLEAVLKGLPNGTYFNVIQYSGSAVKVFPKPVPVSKANMGAAMQAVSGRWTGEYVPGQDPFQMLRNIKLFALKYKPLNRSSKKDSKEALQLAYATADLQSQQIGDGQHGPRDHRALAVKKHLPQIYFLTSGQPDSGARQLLDNIDEFDKGRNIPVNSIAFAVPSDNDAKQFCKDLASKTGGFFRSIEQASWDRRKRDTPAVGGAHDDVRQQKKQK